MAKHNAVSPLLQKSTRPSFLKREGTRTVIASLVSIAIGMALGSVIIVLVAALNDSITMKSAWEGVRLVFFGIFSTGRNALGGLTFGFNAVSIGDMLFRATPLILTGLSVAVAFKTGLFNIGAPPVSDGNGGDAVCCAEHSVREGACRADLASGIFSRRRRGRALGLDSGTAQIIAQYQ